MRQAPRRTDAWIDCKETSLGSKRLALFLAYSSPLMRGLKPEKNSWVENLEQLSEEAFRSCRGLIHAHLADKATTANMMTGGVLFITISVMKAGFWKSV
jgi:hypothetical protein